MKKLEEAVVDGAQELGKRAIKVGTSKGVVVIAYRQGDRAPDIVVRDYKKVKGGWSLAGYSPHSAKTWRALADTILALQRG